MRNFEIPFGDLQHIVIVARFALCFMTGFKNQFCAISETHSGPVCKVLSRWYSVSMEIICRLALVSIWELCMIVDRCSTMSEVLSPSARVELLSPF